MIWLKTSEIGFGVILPVWDKWLFLEVVFFISKLRNEKKNIVKNGMMLVMDGGRAMKASGIMPSDDSGYKKKFIHTPRGGYRIIRKKEGDSKIVEVLYVDKDGVERNERSEWKRYTVCRRALDKVLDWFRWFVERL